MAAAAAATQALLNETLKNVKPPMEGIPSPEEPMRRPLAEWMHLFELFLGARGLEDVLTIGIDPATGEPTPAFDWSTVPPLMKKKDGAVFLLLTGALSYPTSQAVRGLRHSSLLWRRLQKARICCVEM
jgi:hypothetical protein